MSRPNYYYASSLPVFSFFATCVAFRLADVASRHSGFFKLAGRGLQVAAAIALVLAVIANLQNVPRINRIVGIIHNNPFPYGAINQAGTNALRSGAHTVRVPRCGIEPPGTGGHARTDARRIGAILRELATGIVS